MGLDTVELVLAFEEEFGIEIPDEDAQNLITVRDVVMFVKKRLKITPPEECFTQKVFYMLLELPPKTELLLAGLL